MSLFSASQNLIYKIAENSDVTLDIWLSCFGDQSWAKMVPLAQQSHFDLLVTTHHQIKFPRQSEVHF